MSPQDFDAISYLVRQECQGAVPANNERTHEFYPLFQCDIVLNKGQRVKKTHNDCDPINPRYNNGYWTCALFVHRATSTIIKTYHDWYERIPLLSVEPLPGYSVSASNDFVKLN